MKTTLKNGIYCGGTNLVMMDIMVFKKHVKVSFLNKKKIINMIVDLSYLEPLLRKFNFVYIGEV